MTVSVRTDLSTASRIPVWIGIWPHWHLFQQGGRKRALATRMLHVKITCDSRSQRGVLNEFIRADISADEIWISPG